MNTEAAETTLENERITTLKKYDLLDTPPDGSFDRITKLAATIFKVPIAIISLVDTDRIWFKSHYGLPINQIDRSPGLCASAILATDTYIVENAVEDPRTLSNQLVAGEFGLRFYAAVPLQTQDNFNLGTLCIIDKQPRVLTAEEQIILKQLAGLVMIEMDTRLELRKAVNSIKKLSADVTGNLNTAIKDIQSQPRGEGTASLLSYLDSSRMYLMNIENQLQHI